jgi:serralysin
MTRSLVDVTVRIGLCLVGLAVIAAGESAAREPTEQEQYFVELINRARLDPAAEVSRYGLGSLNEGPPTLGPDPYTIPDGPHQPLAINPLLVDAASDYAVLLNDNDQLCHSCLGSDPQDRMFAAGYVDQRSDFDFFGIAGYTLDYGSTVSGYVPGRENLAWRAEGPPNGVIDDLTAAVAVSHEGLFVDYATPSRGHRSTMMYGEWKEVGVGISTDTNGTGGQTLDSLYIVTDFAHRSDTGPFITGVAYDDLDEDGFYTPDAGEALGGVSVEVFEARTSTLVNSTTTFASGGYRTEVPIGAYDVVFSGSGVNAKVRSIAVLASVENGTGENTKVDYVPEPGQSAVSTGALVTLALLATRRRRRSS